MFRSDLRRSLTGPALVAATALALLLGVGHGVFGDSPRPHGVPVILGAIEATLLLATVPFVRRPVAWGAALLAAGTVARALGPGPFAIVDSVVLLGWGAVLVGLRAGLRSGWVAAGAGALAISSLLWSAEWIESLEEPERGVSLAIRVNPVAAIAYGGHDLDWARQRPVTYGQFVGQYYAYRQPTAGDAALTWIVAGAIGAAVALGVSWWSRRLPFGS